MISVEGGPDLPKQGNGVTGGKGEGSARRSIRETEHWSNPLYQCTDTTFCAHTLWSTLLSLHRCARDAVPCRWANHKELCRLPAPPPPAPVRTPAPKSHPKDAATRHTIAKC